VSKVTVTAKTVKEAVESALSQLQTTEELANIRVIEEPSKGFFGFGSKQAVVEVERIEKKLVEQKNQENEKFSTNANEGVDPVEEALQFLSNVLDQMDLDVELERTHEKDHDLIQISGSNVGLIIGRRGQTLDALQYLTNIVANRFSSEYVRVILDAENYRLKRRETLEHLADRVAKKVIRTRSKVVLEPMNPAERKMIHTHLQNYAGISTKSNGVEPNRRIVIYPK
jgi:spoIIIJ-associated protein